MTIFKILDNYYKLEVQSVSPVLVQISADEFNYCKLYKTYELLILDKQGNLKAVKL